MAIVNREFFKSFFVGVSVLLLLSCTIFPSSFSLNPGLFVGHYSRFNDVTASASSESIASFQSQKIPVPFRLKDTLRTSSPNDTARLPHVYGKRYDTTW